MPKREEQNIVRSNISLDRSLTRPESQNTPVWQNKSPEINLDQKRLPSVRDIDFSIHTREASLATSHQEQENKQQIRFVQEQNQEKDKQEKENLNWFQRRVRDIKNVKDTIVSAAENLAKIPVKKILTKGIEIAKEVEWGKVAKTVGSFCLKSAETLLIGAGAFAVNCVLRPKTALGQVLRAGHQVLLVGKSLCDTIGISQLVKGIAEGNPKEAFKGFVKTVGEVTGIADVVKTVTCLAKGDYAGAALHFTFAVLSAGAIASTIATAGAAGGSLLAVAAARTAVKTTAKQVIKKAVTQQALATLGREVAEQALKKTSKEALEKAMKTCVKETVSESTEKLAKIVAKETHTALTAKTVTKTVADIASDKAVKLVKEVGLDQQIEKGTFRLLKDLAKGNSTEVLEVLTKSGLSDDVAKATLKDLKRVAKSRKTDKEMLQLLSRSAHKDISEHIIKNTDAGFKVGFEKSLQTNPVLKEAIELQSKALGKTAKELTEELTEAGLKGYKVGINKGVKQAVRQAMKEAIRKFRARKIGKATPVLKGFDLDLDLHENIYELSKCDDLDTVTKALNDPKVNLDKVKTFDKLMIRDLVDNNGRILRQIIDIDDYKVVSQEIIEDPNRGELPTTEKNENLIQFSQEVKDKEKAA